MEPDEGAGNVTPCAVGTSHSGICQAEGATTPLGRRWLPEELTQLLCSGKRKQQEHGVG